MRGPVFSYGCAVLRMLLNSFNCHHQTQSYCGGAPKYLPQALFHGLLQGPDIPPPPRNGPGAELLSQRTDLIKMNASATMQHTCSILNVINVLGVTKIILYILLCCCQRTLHKPDDIDQVSRIVSLHCLLQTSISALCTYFLRACTMNSASHAVETRVCGTCIQYKQAYSFSVRVSLDIRAFYIVSSAIICRHN